MKLRDALEAFVPAWEKLEAKTSREFCVVAALTVATTREPKTPLAEKFIAWAVDRFGHPDPVQGAFQHALKADYDRMPLEFRELVSAAHRGERTIHDVITWTGEGDDQPMVQTLKKHLLASAGVGGAPQ